MPATAPPSRGCSTSTLKGPPVAGAPLLDSSGEASSASSFAHARGRRRPGRTPEDVVGDLVSDLGVASRPAPRRAACKPVVLGAPVTAIRSFLTHASVADGPVALAGHPRRARAAGNVHGVRVIAVAPSSPAEKAALKPTTDIIVAVDGHPIDTPEKLAEIIAKHVPGDSVKFLVFAGEQFREVAVALRAAP